jgi:hypothetical protein
MGVDLERARVDPSAVFESPEHVLEATQLTSQQKHAILERWHAIARKRPGAADQTTDDGKPCILLRIARALATVEGA